MRSSVRHRAGRLAMLVLSGMIPVACAAPPKGPAGPPSRTATVGDGAPPTQTAESSGIVSPEEQIAKVRGEFARPDVVAARRAEVFQLFVEPETSDAGTTTKPAMTALGTYSVAARAPEQGNAFVARLAQILTDGSSYRTEAFPLMSVGQPVVGVRIQASQGDVDVAFDFDRDFLEIVGRGPGTVELSGGAVCFTPARAALVKLLKGACPADPVIQSLGDKSERVRRTLGDRAVAVMTGADRVECLRIDPRVHRRKSKATQPSTQPAAPPETEPAERIGTYPVIGHGPPPDPRLAADLATALLDDDTYARAMYFTACFEPGVAFRFSKGAESVTYLVCFSCSNISISYEDAAIPEENGKAAVHGSSENLIPGGWDRLADLAKRAFPDDPQIQSLGAKQSATQESPR